MRVEVVERRTTDGAVSRQSIGEFLNPEPSFLNRHAPPRAEATEHAIEFFAAEE